MQEGVWLDYSIWYPNKNRPWADGIDTNPQFLISFLNIFALVNEWVLGGSIRAMPFKNFQLDFGTNVNDKARFLDLSIRLLSTRKTAADLNLK